MIYGSQDYKTFFMLNSTEYEILIADETKGRMVKIKKFSCFKTLRCCIYTANKCLNANICWHFNIY